VSIRRVSVRYDPDVEAWFMRCDSCASSGGSTAWWMLTLEFWNPHSLQRCRACHQVRDRLRTRQTVGQRRARERAYYRKHRSLILRQRRASYAENQELINERRRDAYHRRKQERVETVDKRETED
jgi:hypothetical protein